MEQYWKDYVLLRDQECAQYFKEKETLGKSVFLLGLGFDERMCVGLNVISNTIKDMDIWLIHFKESENSNSELYLGTVGENLQKLKELAMNHPIIDKNISMWENKDGQERAVAELNAAKFVKENIDALAQYDTIIVDISALPQNIYFVMLDRILSQFYGEKNIYIMASENYRIDRKTNPVGLEENAHYFWGYGATNISGSKVDKPIVWMPVLGECTEERLLKCHKCIMLDVQYQEICPVVPFPSMNERRSDEILMKFRELLFERWQVEKKNIIYAAETNPFQLYRRLCETAEHYSKVLVALYRQEIDEKESCKFVFTAMTSKLMSVGTFLAAYNLKKEKYDVAIVGLNNRGYRLATEEHEEKGENAVFCLCLSDQGTW